MSGPTRAPTKRLRSFGPSKINQYSSYSFLPQAMFATLEGQRSGGKGQMLRLLWGVTQAVTKAQSSRVTQVSGSRQVG